MTACAREVGRGQMMINMNYLTKIGNVDENWNAKYCIGMASHPRTG